MAAADPPENKNLPSLSEVREAASKLNGGESAGVCSVSAMLKDRSVACGSVCCVAIRYDFS